MRSGLCIYPDCHLDCHRSAADLAAVCDKVAAGDVEEGTLQIMNSTVNSMSPPIQGDHTQSPEALPGLSWSPNVYQQGVIVE
jgi:hypothetical protein